jgi:hypothetical protein
MIARSRLLGATNVYDLSLYVAHSQYVERQKFDEEEAWTHQRRRWVCRIDVVIVLPSLPVLWLVP